MRQLTSDKAIETINREERVLILLEKSGDPLCKRARQTFRAYSVKLEQLGYKICIVEADENSAKHKELACTRIPQSRVFVNKELAKKHIGVPSEQLLADLMTEKYN
jgi:hypothetical protein